MKITHLEDQQKKMFNTDITARKIRYYIENGFLPPQEALNEKDAPEIYKYLLNIIWLLKEDGMSFEQIKKRIAELAEYQPNPYEPRWPNGSFFFQEEYDPEYYEVHTLDTCRREYLKLYKRVIADKPTCTRLEAESLEDFVSGLDPAAIGMLLTHGLVENQAVSPKRSKRPVARLNNEKPEPDKPQTYDKNDLYLIESIKALQTASPSSAYYTVQVLDKLNRLTDEILELTHTTSDWPVYHILHGMLYNKAKRKFLDASKHFKEFYDEEIGWEFGEISIPGLVHEEDYEEAFLEDHSDSAEGHEESILQHAELLRFSWIDDNVKPQFISRYHYWIKQFDARYPDDAILDPETCQSKYSTKEIYERLRHINSWNQR